MPTNEEVAAGMERFDPKYGLKLKKWGYDYNNQANLPQQAADAVQLEYGQKQRGLENAQLDAISQYNRLVDEEKTYGQEADPRIQNIYGALQNSLGQNTQANQETYGDAIGQIRSWYDQANAANTQLNTDAMGRITQDAERLGIEAGVPGGTQRLTEDFLYNQGQNRNAQAGRSANMAELAAKIQALDRNREGAAGREGTQQRAMLANEIAQTIGDLGMAHYSELAGFRNEQAGMAADRGAAERNALQEFAQRDFENLNTARGSALQEWLARAGLNLQQSEFHRGNFEADRNFGLASEELGLSREDLNLRRELGLGELELGNKQLTAEQQQRQSDDAIKWAELQHRRNELNVEQQRWLREFNEATSPAARARAKAELDRINAETNSLMSESTTYAPGELGLQAYVKDNKISNQTVTTLRNIIAVAQKRSPEDFPTFAQNIINLGERDPVRAGERYGINWNPENSQQLRNMLSVYLTGVGQ